MIIAVIVMLCGYIGKPIRNKTYPTLSNYLNLITDLGLKSQGIAKKFFTGVVAINIGTINCSNTYIDALLSEVKEFMLAQIPLG